MTEVVDLHGDVLNEVDIINYAIYGFVVISYLIIAYLPRFKHVYRGPCRLWSHPSPPHDCLARRWPRVMINSEPIVGIQSMRCLIQLGREYGKVAIQIAFVAVFFEVENQRKHVLFMFITMWCIAATIGFSQMLRMLYQLDYLIFSDAKPTPGTDAWEAFADIYDERNGVGSSSDDTRSRASSHYGDALNTSRSHRSRATTMEGTTRSSIGRFAVGRKWGEYLLAYVAGTKLPATTPQDLKNRKMLKVEAQLTQEQQLDRLEAIVARSHGSFSFALRAIIFVLPLVFGVFHRWAIVVGTAFMIPTLWYLDHSLS